MDTPAPKQTESLQTIKASSYKTMLTMLYRASMQIPANIPDNDPNLRKGIVVDAKAAQTLNKLKTDYIPTLNEVSAEVQTKIAQLGTIKATMPLQENFNQQFNPAKADVMKMIETHDKLLHDIQELIQQQRDTIPKLFQELSNGKTSVAEVNRVLEELRSRQSNMISSTIKLLHDEESLQSKLNAMLRETSLTYAAAKGERYTPPEEVRRLRE